ncbi:efflux RND transporter periplasmic adaptor subunit [Prochlorococcus marinus]|uniref:efflux RND transporter periplasmic adaptor subunit n=1 Tax=Prochlorococcus marinus TaxID=1219 RepID=UPI0022B4F3AA|nr:efflux RND transporter periplasmic adaptor subunit [Prochlorococcus marinus]
MSFLLVMTGGGVLWKLGLGEENSRDITSYTMTAEQGMLSSVINASGELGAIKRININPDRQGLIEEIYIEEGDSVKMGQVIAKIVDKGLPFRLNELNAEFENKKSAYDRRKKLFTEGAISAEKYNEFQRDYLTSKARLDQIKVEKEQLLIKAPFSGVITARYAEPGSYVSPNSQASTNQSSSKRSVVEISYGLQVIAKVPESDIGRISKGQQATIRVEAFPDEIFDSVVENISPRAIKDNNVTSFEVKLSLVEPPQKLLIGMTADVEFQAGKSEIKTLVPTVAIVTRQGEPGLLLVGEKQQPLFQKVELGYSSGSKTAIIKGILPGEQFFIDLPPWAKRKSN